MKFRKFIAWSTIIGTIASLIGAIYIFYPHKSTSIQLDFVLSNCDNLTVFNTTAEPEIKAAFEYKEEKISNLWKLNIILENSANTTIVGYGQNKNLIFDNITFFVKKGFRVIDKKLTHSDFAHTLDIINNDTIVLNFKQWRSKERLEYSLYITADSDSIPNLDIFFQPEDRQIIDGNIIFLIKETNQDTTLLSDILGTSAKKVIYILHLLLSFILFTIFITITISDPIAFIKKRSWKKKYLDIYNTYIVNKHTKDRTSKNDYLNNPSRIINWDIDWPHPAYPNGWGLSLDIDKPFSLIMTTFLFLFLSFTQFTIIIDLIQLFP